MPSKITITIEQVSALRAMLGDADPDLIHDTIQGETDAYELMAWASNKMAEEESFMDAIATRTASLKERAEACKGRVLRLRDVLEALMVATGERSVRLPEATVTLGNRKPGIQSVDESVLPERFFKTTRSVSRSTINEAFAAGEDVPGVVLDNGGVTLTVRRK